MDGERATGTATVLFTDLAGSTELMARLGDERFDAVRADHFAALGAVVARFDGAVVKNTGDGILATFPSSVAALKAAVGLQQATWRQAGRDQLELSLRVGLAVGEVSLEDGDVFGTPVVEAARLVAAARAGQILCTALVQAIAGSRAGHTFVDLGAIELKGLPDPVTVCEVDWTPAEAAPALELPPLLSGGGRIFAGRTEPLERLRQQWKEAVTGERRVVLIGGEPGVGKTRLATALASELHADGAIVLAGRCDEDLGVPYQPMVEALRHYVVKAPVPRLGQHRGELARLVPELPELVRDLPEPLQSDPETERYRLFDAVAAWLSEVSTERPVLLVLDDLHWAAKPTLLLLRHVLRSPEPLRLLVIATYRDTDVGRGHPLADLLADLPRLDGAHRLPLSGLDVPAVLSVLEQAAGHDLGEDGADLARVIWQETEGNAFFVTEILRHLAESGAIQQEDGRWVLTRTLDDLGVPEGVRDVIGRRLSRLSEDANRVLACASVLGLEFDPAIVVAAGGLTEDVVLGALDEAIAARLVVETSGSTLRNRFSHALVRATLYDELSAARKVALHRRVAEAIEAIHDEHLDDHLPALAHHWARASAPSAETGRAVEYARRAGERALAQYANDEAVGYFREALELLDVTPSAGDDRRRLRLLISLGEAQHRGGDAGHRETLLGACDLALQLGDANALAEAALANTRGYVASVAGAVDHPRVATLEAAVAAFPPEDSSIRARLLCTLGLELSFAGDWQRRLSLSDEATAMARRVGDKEALADALMARCTSALRHDTLLRRVEDAAELSEIAASLADPARRARSLITGCRTHLLAGRVIEADRLLRAADESAAEIRQPALQWITLLVHIGRMMIAGRLAEAEQLAAEAAELGRIAGQRETEWAHGTQRFLIDVERGTADHATVDMLQRLAVDFRAAGGSLVLIDVAVPLAQHLAGDTADAQAAFDRLDPEPSQIDYFWLLGEVLRAQLVVALERSDRAEEIYQRLAPYPEWVVPVHVFPTPSVSFHLGLLAGFLKRFDTAEQHFTEAAAESGRMKAAAYLARTQLEWARMLHRRDEAGDLERAHGLLTEAEAAARELGLLNVQRDAAALLGR